MRLCPISALGRFRFFVGWFIVIFLVGFDGHAAAAPISVFVSILPEKYFVERVGGSHVDVSVMVGPGQEPETYEPTPKQMTALSGARSLFPHRGAVRDRLDGKDPGGKPGDARGRSGGGYQETAD